MGSAQRPSGDARGLANATLSPDPAGGKPLRERLLPTEEPVLKTGFPSQASGVGNPPSALVSPPAALDSLLLSTRGTRALFVAPLPLLRMVQDLSIAPPF